MIDHISPKASAPPSRLDHVSYYHQQAGRHPKFDTLESGFERVEVVTGGRGWVLIENEYVEVTPGALLWHVEGDQTISRSDWADPYRCLAVFFQGAHFNGIRRAPRLSWWPDIHAVELFIHELIRAYVDESFDREALLGYTYGRLLFQVRQWERTSARADLPEKLHRAVKLIESARLSVHDAARRVGWSAAHLHEVCRLKLNTTPHEIALQSRMQIARERLAGSDQPLKQIATECGFSSASAFCHAFKKRVGLTPIHYREINQQPYEIPGASSSDFAARTS